MCEAYLHGTEREVPEALQEKGNYQHTFVTVCVYFGYLRCLLSNYTITDRGNPDCYIHCTDYNWRGLFRHLKEKCHEFTGLEFSPFSCKAE